MATNGDSNSLGPALDIIFGRCSVVNAAGEVNEFVTLVIHNTGDVACEALKSYAFRLGFTDAPTRVMKWHASFSGSTYEEQIQDGGRVVVTIALSSALAAGATGIIGVHAHRTGRVRFEGGVLSFVDPVPPDVYQELNVRSATASVTVVYPQTTKGWNITATDATEKTNRTATWEFTHGVHKDIWASGVEWALDAEDPRLLTYDDILAEAHVLFGRLACGEDVQLASILRLARALGSHSSLSSIEPLLLDTASLDRQTQHSRLKNLLRTLREQRILFARELNARSASTQSARLPPGSSQEYSNNMLPIRARNRSRIDELFPSDSDFDGFCLDYFPDVKRRFAGEAERVRRVNLLMEQVKPEALQNALDTYERSRADNVSAPPVPVADLPTAPASPSVPAPSSAAVGTSTAEAPPAAPTTTSASAAASTASVASPSAATPAQPVAAGAAPARAETQTQLGRWPLATIMVVALLILGGVAWWSLRTPIATSGTMTADPCPDPKKQQRVPYRQATICVTNEFADFLACLEASKLEKIADDAKSKIEGGGSVGKGQAETTIKAEKTAIGQIKIDYSAGIASAALGACIHKYEGYGEGPSSTSTADGGSSTRRP